jgi:diaminopimelate epimerase
MKKIKFTKMVASGNDFVILESHQVRAQASPKGTKPQGYHILAKKICDRKFGVGADGLLILEKSQSADVRMRIFNADGSEAEMCGNGARCVAIFSSHAAGGTSHVNIETKAGVIKSEVKDNNVKIKLTDPKNIKLDIPIKVNNRNLKANFIDTGVPHAVVFVEGLDEIHVDEIGRAVRYHKKFAPRGTNVNFVEVLSDNLIAIRTYERGVEDETLACGTGSVASSLIFALKTATGNKIKVQTKSKEFLAVYFKKQNGRFFDVWLEGKAGIVHKGEYYV